MVENGLFCVGEAPWMERGGIDDPHLGPPPSESFLSISIATEPSLPFSTFRWSLSIVASRIAFRLSLARYHGAIGNY